MAERRRRTAAFLRAEAARQGASAPACIFCGGAAAATQCDHVPARALFAGRRWPEGYAFPACSPCNAASAPDEQVLALLVRFGASDERVSEQEFRRALLGVRNNHPGLAESMMMSLRQKRRAIDSLGITRPIGVGVSQVPLLSVHDLRWREAVKRYSAKLARALFYFHTGRVACADAEVTFRWLTALSKDADQLAAEFARYATALAVPARSGQSLDTQFVYRYSVGEEHDIAAFFVVFSPSLCLLLLLDGRASGERAKLEP